MAVRDLRAPSKHAVTIGRRGVPRRGVASVRRSVGASASRITSERSAPPKPSAAPRPRPRPAHRLRGRAGRARRTGPERTCTDDTVSKSVLAVHMAIQYVTDERLRRAESGGRTASITHASRPALAIRWLCPAPGDRWPQIPRRPEYGRHIGGGRHRHLPVPGRASPIRLPPPALPMEARYLAG